MNSFRYAERVRERARRGFPTARSPPCVVFLRGRRRRCVKVRAVTVSESLSVWSNRDFRLVLGGGFVNNVGDWLLAVALPAWCLRARPLAILLLFAAALSPPLFVFVGIIWRDVLFADLWLMAAQVLQATGEAAGARSLIQRGAQWLHATSRQMPDAWRDGFLRRHPANAGLLARAAAGVPT